MRTMILDVRPFAAQLEDGLSMYLRPVPLTRRSFVVVPQRKPYLLNTRESLRSTEQAVRHRLNEKHTEAFVVPQNCFPRGMQMVNTMVRAKLAQISAWDRRNAEVFAVRVADALLQDVEINNDLLTYIDDQLSFLYEQLHSFVGDDVWAVFSHDIVHTDLVVTKGEDFRALCWEEEHGKDFRHRMGRYMN